MIVVIPARYASTRFPGKALADLGGKSVLRRCFEQVTSVVSRSQVIVATDDERIVAECSRFDMRWLLTSSACLTGTDRVAEVAERVDSEWFINVQGDEPFLDPTGLQIIIRRASDAGPEVDLFNAYAQIESESDFRSATVPKVVTTPDGRLLYVSRAPIPTTKSLELVTAKRQIGLYAFRRDALRQFAARDSKTPLESIEDVEILRFLELGFSVQMIEVPESGLAIDTPEDLERARVLLTSLHQS